MLILSLIWPATTVSIYKTVKASVIKFPLKTLGSSELYEHYYKQWVGFFSNTTTTFDKITNADFIFLSVVLYVFYLSNRSKDQIRQVLQNNNRYDHCIGVSICQTKNLIPLTRHFEISSTTLVIKFTVWNLMLNTPNCVSPCWHFSFASISWTTEAPFSLARGGWRKSISDPLLNGQPVSYVLRKKGACTQTHSASVPNDIGYVPRFFLKNKEIEEQLSSWYVTEVYVLCSYVSKTGCLSRDGVYLAFPVRKAVCRCYRIISLINGSLAILMFINRWIKRAWWFICSINAFDVTRWDYCMIHVSVRLIICSLNEIIFTSPVFLMRSQYGFVNHALELLVLRNYGSEVWEDIKWVSQIVLSQITPWPSRPQQGHNAGLLHDQLHTQLSHVLHVLVARRDTYCFFFCNE